jgi:hypothetical protein
MRLSRFAIVLIGAAVALAPVRAFAQEPVLTPVEPGDMIENQFVVSGFVGGSHGGDVDQADVGYGAALDYLRNGRFGFELLGDFTPSVELAGAVTNDLQVNNYMFNAIGAAPIGAEGNWQPYVSGGIGAIRLNSELDDEVFGEADETRFGGNIGFGLMGFADRVGFRADFRYFTGAADEEAVLTDFPPAEDLNFWRSSAGIAVRW